MSRNGLSQMATGTDCLKVLCWRGRLYECVRTPPLNDSVITSSTDTTAGTRHEVTGSRQAEL